MILDVESRSPADPYGHLTNNYSIPSRAYSNPEVVALAKGDAQLSKALQSSRRVGSLLLKQEEQESEKVKRLSEELLKKHRQGAVISVPSPASEDNK